MLSLPTLIVTDGMQLSKKCRTSTNFKISGNIIILAAGKQSLYVEHIIDINFRGQAA